ncbi:MAG: LemA family protein [Candidatus Taylorbacteria bacterium]
MITFAIIAIILVWGVVSYNGLIRTINRAKEAWSDIDVQLKRRYDLIPNLINTVKGYATHESSVFENVTKARAAAMGATSLNDKSQTEATLAGALKSVFAIAEAYPELKANENFMSLQTELADTEDKIQAARRFYNANVRDLNTSVQVFPGNIIAGMFHITAMEFFQLDATEQAAKQPVQVKF